VGANVGRIEREDFKAIPQGSLSALGELCLPCNLRGPASPERIEGKKTNGGLPHSGGSGRERTRKKFGIHQL